jgi:hypothetical protein
MKTPRKFYSAKIALKMKRFYATLDEPGKRHFAGLEAEKLGHGGKIYLRDLLGCDFKTIQKGAKALGSSSKEIRSKRLRKTGGGRKSKVEDKRVNKIFLKVISKHTAGSPEEENKKWTYLNQEEIVDEMRSRNVDVSRRVVRQLLPKHDYVKRKSQKKSIGGKQEPKRTV